jgi:uncharacterized membrane protein
MIVLTGALIDIFVWSISPFVTFDVLYLLGFAIPVCALAMRLPPLARLGLVGLVFALTPILELTLGYPHDIVHVDASHIYEYPLRIAIHQWTLSGWFPVFPWLGFALLGTTWSGPIPGACQGSAEPPALPTALLNAAADHRPDAGAVRGFLSWSPLPAANSVRLGVIGVACVSLGAVIFERIPGPLLVRDGYSELFYPPTLTYLLLAVGVLLLATAVIPHVPSKLAYPFLLLGRTALVVYVLHEVLIQYVLGPAFGEVPMPKFAAMYAVVIVSFILLAAAIDAYKKRRRSYHWLIRFALGS